MILELTLAKPYRQVVKNRVGQYFNKSSILPDQVTAIQLLPAFSHHIIIA